MPAAAFFAELEAQVIPENIAGIDHSYLFDVTDEGKWLVEVRNSTVSVSDGEGRDADVTIEVSSAVFDKIASGQQNPATAYMTGKVKIHGDIAAAMKLQKLF